MSKRHCFSGEIEALEKARRSGSSKEFTFNIEIECKRNNILGAKLFGRNIERLETFFH
jgi:hypothetical protein